MQRVDPRILGLIALCGAALGSAFVASYNRGASFDELLWPQVLLGVFIGGLFPPFVAIGLSGLRGATELRAATLLNLLRVAGQGLGIPLFMILWDRRRIVHHHFLVEPRAGGRQQIAFATHILRAHNLSAPVIHALIAQQLHHLSAVLALNEVFYEAAWTFLGLGILLLLARPVVFSEPDTRKRRALQELVEP
jgi:DHA2 family multidrug resistance protein